MPHQPDIILLVLDTQRADHLSCYGYGRATSPALDALASDATRYAAATATAQWTVPTHASFFTGLYPSQHTMHQMNSVLPPQIPTLAQRLSAAGYFTAGYSQNPHIGLVKNDLDRGFMHFGSYHLLSNILLTSRLNRSEPSYSLSKRLQLGLRWLLAEALGYSHETPLQHLAPILMPLWQRLLHARGHSKMASTSTLLEEAARLLLRQGHDISDQPVFAFINLMGTHVPYDPDRRQLAQFLPDLHAGETVLGLLRWANQTQIDVHNWLDEPLPARQQRLLNAIYDAEVATQDAQVGAFLQRLREGGRFDQTVIVVVSDHGDHLGDKDRVNHGFGVYQALVHVPLIIRDPAQQSGFGEVNTEPVSTRRLFHTLLAAASAATDEEALLALSHGARSAEDGNFSGSVFSEGFPLEWAVGRLSGEKARRTREDGHTETVRAVREGHFKLLDGAGWRELYDLGQDPAEEDDLQATAAQDVIDRLQRRLHDFTLWAKPVAVAETQEEDDPQVLQQLRDLGYLD